MHLPVSGSSWSHGTAVYCRRSVFGMVGAFIVSGLSPWSRAVTLDSVSAMQLRVARAVGLNFDSRIPLSLARLGLSLSLCVAEASGGGESARGSRAFVVIARRDSFVDPRLPWLTSSAPRRWEASSVHVARKGSAVMLVVAASHCPIPPVALRSVFRASAPTACCPHGLPFEGSGRLAAQSEVPFLHRPEPNNHARPASVGRVAPTGL